MLLYGLPVEPGRSQGRGGWERVVVLKLFASTRLLLEVTFSQGFVPVVSVDVFAIGNAVEACVGRARSQGFGGGADMADTMSTAAQSRQG